MGLIRAGLGAAGGVLADQWKEFFYCEALPADVLAVKGSKQVSGRSANTAGEDNIISNGSVIAVADGQCMIIVEQGAVVDVCAEPGQFIFDSASAPSVFAGGDVGENLVGSLKSAFERFKFGGSPGLDTRVYYVNTKEVIGNKYGTANPVPFRVVDQNIGLDIDIAIRCFGEYSYRIVNPILFYSNVCGNVTGAYTRDTIDSQLKAELLTAMQPAFARISAMGVRYSALPGHTVELADALNEVLSAKWRDLRGVEIVSFGVASVAASPEDEQMIKDLQKSAVMRDPSMAAGALVSAQADAMRTAAGNEGGAMLGLMGMTMAQQAGGANPASMMAMGQQGYAGPPPSAYATAPAGGFPPPAAPAGYAPSAPGVPSQAAPGVPQTPPAAPPQALPGWTCVCGSVNQGRFCANCGQPKPTGVPLYACDKCGWRPADPANPPRFCPECGDVFNDRDAQ